jgi:DNA-binding IclR family transcriptional regulator
LRHAADTTARSITRVIAMLNHVAYHPRGMRASDLQRAMKIPRASLYRVLNALVKERFIEQDTASGLYHAGPAAMNIGFMARQASPLIQTAQPVLRDLARATGQLSELMIAIDNWRSVALDVWLGRDTPLFVQIRPGHFVNITHRYVPCEIFLAFGGEHRLREYVRLSQTVEGRERLGLTEPAGNDVIERMQRWQRLGYIWDRQSGNPGVGRMAAPVFDRSSRTPKLLAALGIACSGRLLTTMRAAQWGQMVCEHARKLEVLSHAKAQRR